jgi:hypothetical protein
MALEDREDLSVHQQFVEYRTVSGSEPLQQGDVLEAVDASSPRWKKYLLVITADCDFAYNKHRGRVTCVPFLTSHDYLLEMEVPRLRERLIKKPMKDLKEILVRTNGPVISDDRLKEWISEEDPEAIVSSLEMVGLEAESALKSVSSLRLFQADADSLQSAIIGLIEAQLMTVGPPSRKNAVKVVQDALQNAFIQPPGDALFISAIAPEHEEGYFAYLRHLEQIWETEIATTPGRKEALYRRIARLQDRYIHSLVQKFAIVFMSIGLPSEYEDMRNLHCDLLKEDIS